MQLFKIELKSRFYGSKPLFWPSVSIDCRLILKRIKMWFFLKCKGFSQNCAKSLHLNNSKVYTDMLGLRYFWIVRQALNKKLWCDRLSVRLIKAFIFRDFKLFNFPVRQSAKYIFLPLFNLSRLYSLSAMSERSVHLPPVKSGKATGAPPFATDSSLKAVIHI